MSKISTYEVTPVPKLADKLIGTSVGGEIEDITYNFTLSELLNLFIPNIPANTLQGVLDYGNEATQDIILNGTIFTTYLEVTDSATILNSYLTGEIHLTGGLYDSLDSIGTAGQVLTSTGSGVEWYSIPTVIPTLQQVLASGNTADINIILSSNIQALTATANNVVSNTSLSVNGTLKDVNASSGTSGQILSSTGTGVDWIDLPVYTATSPLSINSGTKNISIQKADSTHDGYLSSADWINFDGKQNPISLTTTGSSGAATFVSNVLNVPNYTLSGLGGVPQSRTLTINGVTYDLSANRSWTIAAGVASVTATAPLSSTGGANPDISITKSDNLTDGYLSSTDWVTFNNKQNYLSGSGLVKSTSGTITYITDNSSNWNTAYNDSIVSAAVTGTSTKTLTLTQQDAGTITANWTDLGLTSVGISMPSAFSVSNSPLTSNGTISISGAGSALQYIDGTGALQSFPSLSGFVTSVTATSPLASSGGTTPNVTIQQSSDSQNGYLSSTDWTTFNNKQASGNYITSLTGEATASGPGAASVTLSNAAVTGKVLTGVNITGGSISATDSILTAFGKVQNQINGLVGGSIYQGTWNASTNTPTLASGVGTKGYYYIVSVAGTTNLDGITDWFVGDWVIFDGTAWQQVDNTDSVVSVNGQTGAVSLTTDNIPEGTTNLYYLDSRARAALSFTAGSGAYNSSTGVITIPTNTSQLTNGANFITLASLSATSPISYNNTTGDISIPQSNSSTSGYLSATDWTTFNSKQNAITNPVTGTGTSGYVTYWNGSSSATGSSNLFWDSTNNRLGINNAVPLYDLDVTGLARITGTILTNSFVGVSKTTGGTYFSMTNGTDASLYLSLTAVGASTKYATITGGGGLNLNIALATSGGNVGINTTTPTYNLDVSGTFRTTGNAIFGGTLGNGTYTYTLPSATGTLALVGGSGVGTVTSVAALTIGTSGTDLSSTVVNSTTTPVITLNVPTASATNRGALSSADWNTFNNKQNTITNPVTGTSTSGYVTYWNGTSSVAGSVNHYWDNTNSRLGIGTNNPQRSLTIYNATADNHLQIAGVAPSVSLTDAVTGATYQAKFGLATASGQYATGAVAGDFVIISQTGATIWANSGGERMRLTSGGNVGIGTSSPVSILNLSSTTPTLTITDSAATGNGGNVYISAVKSGVGYNNLTMTAYTYNLLGGGSATSFLNINSAGNVGIGTSSPSSILHAYRNNGTDINFTIENGSTAGYSSSIKLVSAVDFGAGYHSISSNTSGGNVHWSIGSGGTTNTMVFYTNNNAERMRITSGGNVGIGTGSPTAQLQVSITSTSQNAAYIEQNAAYNGLAVTSSGNSGTYYIANFRSTGVDRMRILDNGNVGIGTNTPQSILHITGALTFTESGFPTVRLNQIVSAHSDGSSPNNNIRFLVSDGSGTTTERMRINGSGNLLIGTTIPTGVLTIGDGVKASNSVPFVIQTSDANTMQYVMTRFSNNSYRIQVVEQGVAYRDLWFNQDGGAVYAGTQRIDNNSDIRVKKNIVPVTNALNTILSLNGKKFNMIDEDNILRYGFIAQEVQPVLNDFVTKSSRAYKDRDYVIDNLLTLESSGSAWAALLVEAIKEQQAQIEELKSLINK
jgi:hypothetical protein